MQKSIAENRDCMAAMKEFPDKFFYIAVVDPPYGIDICSQTVQVERERERESRRRGYDGLLRSLAEVTPLGRLGPMNPEWVEWLMGFPTGWTELSASGTR